MTPTTPGCLDLETLSAHLDGELPSDAAAGVEAHLAACEQCSALAARLKGAASLVRSLPRPTASEALVAATLRAVREDASGRSASRPKAWAFAGIAATLIVGALLIQAVIQPPPAAAPAVAQAKAKEVAQGQASPAVDEPQAESLDRKQDQAKDQSQAAPAGPAMADERRESAGADDMLDPLAKKRDGSTLGAQEEADAPERKLLAGAAGQRGSLAPADAPQGTTEQEASAPSTPAASRDNESTADLPARGQVSSEAGASSTVVSEATFASLPAERSDADKTAGLAVEPPSARFRTDSGASVAAKAEAAPAPANAPRRQAPAASAPQPPVGAVSGGKFPQPPCLPASGGPAEASPAAIARGELQVPPWMNWIPAGAGSPDAFTAGPVTVDFVVRADGSLERRDVAGAGPAAADLLPALGRALEPPVPARCAGQPVALAARVRYRREADGWRGEVLGAGR